MPRLLEFGLLNGHPLLMLQKQLTHVCGKKRITITAITNNQIETCECTIYSHCVSCQVYIPLLTVHQMKITGGGYQSRAPSPQKEPSGDKEPPVKVDGQSTIRDELLNSTHKFLAMVNTTLQHLRTQGLFYSIEEDYEEDYSA